MNPTVIITLMCGLMVAALICWMTGLIPLTGLLVLIVIMLGVLLALSLDTDDPLEADDGHVPLCKSRYNRTGRRCRRCGQVH